MDFHPSLNQKKIIIKSLFTFLKQIISSLDKKWMTEKF